MNTLVSVAISPSGTGEELCCEVAQVIKVIRASGLKNRTNSMFTEIEGPWDDVMKVVKEAAFVLAEQGIRTGRCAQSRYPARIYRHDDGQS